MGYDPKGGEVKGGILSNRFPLFRYTERGLASIETFFNLISTGIIMFLMFFASAEILGRFLLNNPIPGHVEIVELLMAAMVFLGIAYTQQVDGHIRMQTLLNSLFKGRRRHFVEMIIWGLSFLAFGVITIGSFRFSVEAYQGGDITSYIKWPTWPFKVCIPIGSFLLSIRLLFQFLHHLAEVFLGIRHRKLG